MIPASVLGSSKELITLVLRPFVDILMLFSSLVSFWVRLISWPIDLVSFVWKQSRIAKVFRARPGVLALGMGLLLIGVVIGVVLGRATAHLR